MKVFVIKFLVFSFLFIPFFGLTQFEFELAFGGNTTTAKTIAGGNRTWGYRVTNILPNTWSNHFVVGYRVSKKNKFALGFDSGALGINYRLRVNTDKYPLYEFEGNSLEGTLSDATAISFGSFRATSLLKFSAVNEHLWWGDKIKHSSIVGLGVLKTRVNNTLGNAGGFHYIDTASVYTYHSFTIDKYGYLRKANLYLIAGYKCSYELGKRWELNAKIIYNQGVFKMVKWHAYRTYFESFSNYTEFDEQWSYTRLSYFAFLTGVTYKLEKRARN